MQDIRYCLLSFDYWENDEANSFGEADVPISGLFNWARIFNGKRAFPRTPAEWSEFNLVHINLTTKNMLLLPGVLKNVDRTTTKILMNVDYAVDMWKDSFPYPDAMLEQLDKADYLFGVEPVMCEIIAHRLRRPVAHIPHPVATHLLSGMRTAERLSQIGVSIHRYDANFLLPHFVVGDLPHGFQSIAFGSTADKKGLLHLYDFMKPNAGFAEFMPFVASLYAIVESYTLLSYGRLTAEAAFLGVPVVGAPCVESQSRCFPLLCSSNPMHQRALVHRLISDSAFYSSVANYGIEKSEFYSFGSCEKMMRSLLSSTSH
jgi:hypothetical protein